MIEFFEVMFRALTGLKLTMPNLIIIFGFFIAGYYFAKTTKQLSLIKAFFVLILGYWISNILSALLGVFTLAFILGFLSNTGYFILRTVLWVDNLKELWFFLQHRIVAEDIYQSEEAPNNDTNSNQDNTEEKFEESFSSKSHKKPETDDWKPSDIYSPDDYIKKAYRRMAMKYHPDIRGTGDQEKFVLGTEAYEYLERYYARYTG